MIYTLRKALIFFGFAVPIVAVLSLGIQIVMSFSLMNSEFSEDLSDNMMRVVFSRIISSVLSLVDNFAIAALCFYGAYRIKPFGKNTDPSVFGDKP